MKKTYIFCLIVTMFSFGFSQSTIVTVASENITSATSSGNSLEISSIGLTRGTGVSIASTGEEHSTSKWNGTSQTEVEANNDYIEWSVSANASNSVEITEFDIRTRRHNIYGPANWQIFYSLDNFTTAGIPATSVQSSTLADTDFNFSGLSIISGTGGTITFRLYAWNAASVNSWIRIVSQPAWSDFGIAKPGLRLIGNISTTTPNDTESNIVATSFNPSDNIDYTLYNAVSGLTTTNAIKVGEFAIQDGGDDLLDTDTLNTILTDLAFSIANGSNISSLAIFDGVTNIAETIVTSESAIFSSISGLSAPDNASKTFSVYATFGTTVNDNEQFQLTISSASADNTLGSVFSLFDAGGAQTPIIGDDNRIEVSASGVVFDQQPSDSFQFETMTPFPTLIAVDVNGNQDLDYNDTFNVISSGSLDPSPIIYSMTNGLATFNSIVFTDKETVTTLLAFSGSFFAASTSFNIDGPLITIAHQDFDGSSPEWTYSTDVTTFDNGWGTDGYYGIIDSSIISPLDNSTFSNNIFGENDLNDEGENGTNGFATLTLDPIDISSYNDIKLLFDWDVDGYENDVDDAQYRLIYDGVLQPVVFLLNGDSNSPIDSKQGKVAIDIPDSVTSLSLEISIRNNGINGYSGFDNFRIVSLFDGLLYTNNGWSPNAPSGTTGSDNAYILDGTYVVGTDIVIDNLFINNAATTTITPGQSIVTNTGIVNSGTLELNSVSTSFSSLITDNITGEIVYNRHVNQFADSGSSTGNNDLISAPVTNSAQTFLALRTANSDIPSGTIGGVPSFLFGPFDNNANVYVNYTAADDNSVITSGIGYRTASIQPTGSTFRFVGDVEVGSISTPITVGTSSTFNLVGNPYPSYISLSAFLATNNSELDDINSGVYGYDGDASDGFTIWNQAYSDANPTAVITPGQGFFLSSQIGGGTISFTPAMRSVGTTDDFIAGRPNQNLAHLKLQLLKGDMSYNTDVYFNDNASLGMDSGYDSAMFENDTPDFAMYSHLVENNVGKDMAVQSVSYSDLENVIIPLGINITQGEQAIVSILESDIPEDVTVILEDNVSNTFTNLQTGDYTFTPTTTLTETGRFYLHLSRGVLGTTENVLNGLEIYTNVNPKQIVVKGQLDGKTTLQLYDIQGRIVNTQVLNTETTKNSIDVSNLSAGIYVVQIQSAAGSRTQKVILK